MKQHSLMMISLKSCWCSLLFYFFPTKWLEFHAAASLNSKTQFAPSLCSVENIFFFIWILWMHCCCCAFPLWLTNILYIFQDCFYGKQLSKLQCILFVHSHENKLNAHVFYILYRIGLGYGNVHDVYMIFVEILFVLFVSILPEHTSVIALFKSDFNNFRFCKNRNKFSTKIQNTKK